MRSAIESFFLYHRYNATVLSLEELLNSSFDPEQKRIRLKGYDLITSNIIRSEEENTDDHFILFVDQQEQNTRSSHLFTDGEQDNLHIFKLQIPADLENNKDTIQKMLVHYVPIGITFITEIN